MVQEKTKEYGQDILLDAEATNGIGKVEKEALRNLTRLSKNGLVKTMKRRSLMHWLQVDQMLQEYLQ